MKKIYLMAALFAATYAHAQNESFESFTLDSAESFWQGPSETGIVYDNVTASYIVFDEMELINLFDESWPPGYWSNGFAFSNQTGDTLSGIPGAYASYANGASDGNNYVLGKNGAEIILTAGLSLTSLEITNNCYAAQSMLNGDMFSKQFGDSLDANDVADGTNGEDWFKLSIYAIDENGFEIDSIEFLLADYQFENSNDDYIVKEWTSVDLSSFPVGVSKLRFDLSSSDNSFGWMNTPNYFALDNIVYTTVGVEEIDEVTFKAFPNPTAASLNITSSDLIKTLMVYDLSGKIVIDSSVNSKRVQLNFANLEAGIYNVKVITDKGVSTKRIIKQ